MPRVKPIIFLAFWLLIIPHFSRAHNRDSLVSKLAHSKDTTRINILLQLSDIALGSGNLDQSDSILIKAKEENSLSKSELFELRILLKLSNLYYRKSNFKKAKDYANSAKLIAEKLKHVVFLGDAYTFIGMNTGRLGDFKKAVDLYQEALGYYEKENYHQGIMRVNTCLAGIYFDQLDYKTAIAYFQKTLALAKKINDKKNIASTLNNIGSALQNSNNSSEAKKYYLEAAEINLACNNLNNLAYNYMNLAYCELEIDNIPKAHEYNTKAISIFKRHQDVYSLVGGYSAEAEIFLAEKQYGKAVAILKEAVSLAESTDSPLLQERVYNAIAQAYEAEGDFRNSHFYFKKYIATRDSIINNEIRAEVTRKQMQYEFDKKLVSDSVLNATKHLYMQQQIDTSKKAENMQKRISVISIISLIVMLVLSAFIFRGYRLNKKANILIERQKQAVELQKELVEEKNREIVDSITYARQLQGAILPSEKIWKHHLPESFVFYKPKDIVAGDFYWMHNFSSDLGAGGSEILIAAADCTGHGVPGAMISLVCSNSLNRANATTGH